MTSAEVRRIRAEDGASQPNRPRGNQCVQTAVAEKAAGGTNAAGAEKVGDPLDARMKVVCGIYATKAAARKARTARTSIARVAITVG